MRVLATQDIKYGGRPTRSAPVAKDDLQHRWANGRFDGLAAAWLSNFVGATPVGAPPLRGPVAA